jgi:hypothetical protein
MKHQGFFLRVRWSKKSGNRLVQGTPTRVSVTNPGSMHEYRVRLPSARVGVYSSLRIRCVLIVVDGELFSRNDKV